MLNRLALLALLALAPGLHAQEVSTSVTLANDYRWRGATLADRPVVQPEVGVTVGAFSVSAWGSVAMSNRATLGAADEFDLTLAYALPTLGGAAVTLGAIAYALPNQKRFAVGEHVTAEVFASADLPLPLAPSLALHYDFANGDGFYAQASAGHEVFASGPYAASVQASAGYDAGQFGADPTFTHAQAALALGIGWRGVTLEPHAGYIWGLRPGGEGAPAFGLTVSH
jgi:hypothetical protein